MIGKLNSTFKLWLEDRLINDDFSLLVKVSTFTFSSQIFQSQLLQPRIKLIKIHTVCNNTERSIITQTLIHFGTLNVLCMHNPKNANDFNNFLGACIIIMQLIFLQNIRWIKIIFFISVKKNKLVFLLPTFIRKKIWVVYVTLHGNSHSQTGHQ